MKTDIETKAQAIIDAARASKTSISVAESCTGGGLGAALTAIPGSSRVFKGGIIAYANSVKSGFLDVPPGMMYKYGAVSNHVARSMAQSVRTAMGVDIAISITGVAGPGGGSEDKPVGTVWIGVASGDDVSTHHNLFADLDRAGVRDAAILRSLDLLDEALRKT